MPNENKAQIREITEILSVLDGSDLALVKASADALRNSAIMHKEAD